MTSTPLKKNFVAPALPLPPAQYSQGQQDQIQNALRLYFNLIDNYLAVVTALLNNGGYFDQINVGNLTADNITASNLYSTYGEFDNFKAVSNQLNTIINRQLVSGTIMSSHTYGGMFYGDGRYISTPYNQFESDQDQTGAVATATAVTFNTDLFPDSISIVNNSEITFGQSGIYLLTYSFAFKNPTNDRQDIDIWFRYEGVDIPNSNSKFSIPARKSTGDPSFLIAVTPYMVDVTNPGDQVQIMFRVTDAAVVLEHLAAVTASPGVTPAIPATPSAILTVQFISSQFPPVQRVAPAPVIGFTELGDVVVATNRT